ncbi:AlpA family phage regulatory protein [uncultured Herbaspirillum sp.]|uniref:helix-turn-helix transcriptional regulator n=1 Tax=uncultured Herbaspirillum sp. TaxID=160236 RepID=UPI002604337F|nr:AlpA family phage regulatory protein [uncultured Herbaspirillum sp.]
MTQADSIPQNTKNAATIPDRIIRLQTVIDRTGLSRSSIYRAMHAGKFPARFHMPPSGHSIGWSEREIDNFVAELKTAQNKEGK